MRVILVHTCLVKGLEVDRFVHVMAPVASTYVCPSVAIMRQDNFTHFTFFGRWGISWRPRYSSPPPPLSSASPSRGPSSRLICFLAAGLTAAPFDFELTSKYYSIFVTGLIIMSGPADSAEFVGLVGELTEPAIPQVGLPSVTAEGTDPGGQAGGGETPPAAGAMSEAGRVATPAPSSAIPPGGPLRPAMTPPPDVVADIKAKGGGLTWYYHIALSLKMLDNGLWLQPASTTPITSALQRALATRMLMTS